MSVATKTVAVLACVGALLGVGSTAASASTTRTAARNQLGSSQGFHVYNLTGDALTLSGIQGSKQFEGAPEIGSVLQPGAVATFEVKWVSSWDWDYITYRNAQGQPVSFQIGVEEGWLPSSKCYASSAYECSRQFVHQKDITIAEPVGTVHELNGVQAQAESEIVRRLCGDGGAATCDFSPQGEPQHVMGPRHLVVWHTNTGDETDDWEITTKDSVEDTNSLDISISAGSTFEAFGQKIDLEIKTTYGHEWTRKHGFDVSANIPVKPGRTGYLYAQAPLLVYTGTVTVTMGNSTWKLHGVHFDSPDPDGAPGTEAVSGPAYLTPLEPAQHS